MQYLKLFQSFEKSCCVFSFPLTCEENETQACIGVFQWCEAFSNLHPDQFRKGEGWDHYTVTVYVWCAPSVTGKIFNWNEPFEVFFFYYNSLLQPDEQTAGVSSRTTEQANQPFSTYCSFPWTNDVQCFNLPDFPYTCCTVRSTSHSLILWLTTNQYYTHAWINEISLIEVQQILVWPQLPPIRGVLVLFWLPELSGNKNRWNLLTVTTLQGECNMICLDTKHLKLQNTIKHLTSVWK